MFALLVLTVERFLALTYPFFHQTSVTKQRLIFLLVVLIVLPTVVLSSSHFISVTILANVLSTISISVFLFLFIYFNYKMFIIARSNATTKQVQNQVTKKEKELIYSSNCFLRTGSYLLFSLLGSISGIFCTTSDNK